MRIGEEIVARAVRRIVARGRISGTPISQIGRWIVGARDVERATARLPGVDLVLPSLAARLAGRRHRKSLPLLLAGLGIERREPAAHAVVAAGAANDHRILERQRRRGDFHVGLIVEVLVPHDLAGFLVGGDHPAVEAGNRNDEIAPQRDAAVAIGLLHAGIHLPYDLTCRSRADVDLIDDAPDVGDVHEAVFDHRRCFVVFVARRAAERHREGELEILHVRRVDDIEWRIAVRTEIAMIHQPVLRFGIHEPFERHVGRAPSIRSKQNTGHREQVGRHRHAAEFRALSHVLSLPFCRFAVQRIARTGA